MCAISKPGRELPEVIYGYYVGHLGQMERRQFKTAVKAAWNSANMRGNPDMLALSENARRVIVAKAKRINAQAKQMSLLN